MGDNGFGSAFLTVLFALAAAWFVAVGWVASWLLVAAGRARSFEMSDGNILVANYRMFAGRSDPAAAWGMDVDAAVFWSVFCALIVVSWLALGVVGRVVTRKNWGLVARRRLGTETEVRMAKVKDLETLWTRMEPQSRLLLGRTVRGRGQWRSQLLATERADDPNRRRVSRRGRKRANDRGAVMVMGPSRSGKSVNVLSGVLQWEGPVVLSSIKDDLVGPTLAHRRRQGEVAVFDPTDNLSNAYGPDSVMTPAGWDERLKVSWTPLRAADTFNGAARAARAITTASPESEGAESGKMWRDLAEQLLAGLLFAAAFAGRDMTTVSRWVLSMDRPTPEAHGEVKQHLLEAMASRDPMVVDDAARAHTALEAVWKQDPKIVSSVYTTANTLVYAWMAREVEQSASGRSVDLEWLAAGNNSLYVVAPPQDSKRLSPLFGGVVNDLVEQAFVRAQSEGPLDPPLLIVLDEAGNMPLLRLPEFASTVAGLGIQLVTVWQSVAQIEAIYGREKGTVIANHLTKILFPAQSDGDTLEMFSKLVGEEEVLTHIDSGEKTTIFKGSVQSQGTRLAATPTNVIRMMHRGDSLLVHGSLYPAHVTSIPWFKDRRLRRLQKWDPERDGEVGLPVSLGSTGVEVVTEQATPGLLAALR